MREEYLSTYTFIHWQREHLYERVTGGERASAIGEASWLASERASERALGRLPSVAVRFPRAHTHKLSLSLARSPAVASLQAFSRCTEPLVVSRRPSLMALSWRNWLIRARMLDRCRPLLVDSSRIVDTKPDESESANKWRREEAKLKRATERLARAIWTAAGEMGGLVS